MEYTVIESSNLSTLITEVNHYISDGWIPQGGICESGENGELLFFQALIKKQ